VRSEIEQLTAGVVALLDRGVWPLSDVEVVDGLAAVSCAIERLGVVQAALVREVDARALHVADGSTSVAIWLRDRLRVSVRAGRQLARLARMLDERPAIRDALADGMATVEQGLVIGDTLERLPAGLGDEIRDKAEAVLLGHADQFEPGLLRRLGERVLDHVAPEIADAALATRLDADERRGHARRHFTLSPTDHGGARVSGWLDSETAATVVAAIDPLSRPAPGVAGEPDLRTPGQRRADALAEVCRLVLTAGELPDCGGERPQINVTTRLDVLTGCLGIGETDTGVTLSAATVRRLACDAELVPAVLGGDGAVLDLGRGKRLFVGSARRALVLRDGGCAFPACDRPPRWCQAHHMVSWVDGGATTQANGVLLCGYHHRLIHHGDWQVRPGADGRPDFIPPPHVDRARRPVRNLYHRRM
jgi:hypothetical protein